MSFSNKLKDLKGTSVIGSDLVYTVDSKTKVYVKPDGSQVIVKSK